MSDLIKKQALELLSETEDFIANASNFTAFIFDNIENLNWCGFYFDNGKELILSVFKGKVACIKIPYESGVCGHSFSSNKTVIVDDVHKFDGHIACDSASNSEMVIPINFNNKIIGVFDLDSPIFSRFNKATHDVIQELLKIFQSKTDFSKVVKYYHD